MNDIGICNSLSIYNNCVYFNELQSHKMKTIELMDKMAAKTKYVIILCLLFALSMLFHVSYF